MIFDFTPTPISVNVFFQILIWILGLCTVIVYAIAHYPRRFVGTVTTNETKSFHRRLPNWESIFFLVLSLCVCASVWELILPWKENCVIVLRSRTTDEKLPNKDYEETFQSAFEHKKPVYDLGVIVDTVLEECLKESPEIWLTGSPAEREKLRGKILHLSQKNFGNIRVSQVNDIDKNIKSVNSSDKSCPQWLIASVEISLLEWYHHQCNVKYAYIYRNQTEGQIDVWSIVKSLWGEKITIKPKLQEPQQKNRIDRIFAAQLKKNDSGKFSLSFFIQGNITQNTEIPFKFYNNTGEYPKTYTFCSDLDPLYPFYVEMNDISEEYDYMTDDTGKIQANIQYEKEEKIKLTGNATAVWEKLKDRDSPRDNKVYDETGKEVTIDVISRSDFHRKRDVIIISNENGTSDAKTYLDGINLDSSNTEIIAGKVSSLRGTSQWSVPAADSLYNIPCFPDYPDFSVKIDDNKGFRPVEFARRVKNSDLIIARRYDEHQIPILCVRQNKGKTTAILDLGYEIDSMDPIIKNSFFATVDKTIKAIHNNSIFRYETVRNWQTIPKEITAASVFHPEDLTDESVRPCFFCNWWIVSFIAVYFVSLALRIGRCRWQH